MLELRNRELLLKQEKQAQDVALRLQLEDAQLRAAVKQREEELKQRVEDVQRREAAVKQREEELAKQREGAFRAEMERQDLIRKVANEALAKLEGAKK